MGDIKKVPAQVLDLRRETLGWYQRFLLDTGDGGGNGDSGSWLHDSGSAAPFRKIELPRLAACAMGLSGKGATSIGSAGFRSLALELEAMGAPLSDTGVA